MSKGAINLHGYSDWFSFRVFQLFIPREVLNLLSRLSGDNLYYLNQFEFCCRTSQKKVYGPYFLTLANTSKQIRAPDILE